MYVGGLYYLQICSEETYRHGKKKTLLYMQWRSGLRGMQTFLSLIPFVLKFSGSAPVTYVSIGNEGNNLTLRNLMFL